jgi:hypothetical protein
MKLTFALVGLVCCGCLSLAEEVVDNKQKKRSIGDDYFGLPLTDTSISSHTHTHTTAVVDRPVPVPVPITTTKIISPAITTTKIISPAFTPSIYPSTFSSAYSLGSSYPSLSSYSSYPSLSSYSSLPSYGLGYGKYYGGFAKSYPTFTKYPTFGKYYSSSVYPSIYSKPYYKPSIYKW